MVLHNMDVVKARLIQNNLESAWLNWLRQTAVCGLENAQFQN